MSGHANRAKNEFHGEPLAATPSHEPKAPLTEDEWGTGPLGEAPHRIEPDDDLVVDEFGTKSQKRASRLGLTAVVALIVAALVVAALVGYGFAR